MDHETTLRQGLQGWCVYGAVGLVPFLGGCRGNRAWDFLMEFVGFGACRVCTPSGLRLRVQDSRTLGSEVRLGV